MSKWSSFCRRTGKHLVTKPRVTAPLWNSLFTDALSQPCENPHIQVLNLSCAWNYFSNQPQSPLKDASERALKEAGGALVEVGLFAP